MLLPAVNYAAIHSHYIPLWMLCICIGSNQQLEEVTKIWISRRPQSCTEPLPQLLYNAFYGGSCDEQEDSIGVSHDGSLAVRHGAQLNAIANGALREAREATGSPTYLEFGPLYWGYWLSEDLD